MLQGGSATNDKDILKDRILKYIPPEDLAKVDQNAGLRNIKDNALAYETAAEELFKDIQEACIKAKWRVQMADGVKQQKSQAVKDAIHHESLTRAEFLPCQEHYNAISHEQDQAVQQANNVTRQACHEHAQACEAADRCRKVAMFKNRLGMVAMGGMLDGQQKHTRDARHRITGALWAQQEAENREASAA